MIHPFMNVSDHFRTCPATNNSRSIYRSWAARWAFWRIRARLCSTLFFVIYPNNDPQPWTDSFLLFAFLFIGAGDFFEGELFCNILYICTHDVSFLFRSKNSFEKIQKTNESSNFSDRETEDKHVIELNLCSFPARNGLSALLFATVEIVGHGGHWRWRWNCQNRCRQRRRSEMDLFKSIIGPDE